MQSEDQVRDLIARRIDVQRRSPGMVVGLLSPEGRRVLPYGKADGDRPVAEDTLFEIGSITKLFTATLLSDAVLRGELALADPVADHLPPGTKVPAFDGRPITLLDLATHVSGLPSFLPDSPPFGDPGWATYTQGDLLADLGKIQLTREIGSKWEYSNTGFGLIGIALEKVTGRSFETLLRERILDPLGMTSTAITLTPELEARRAHPHGVDGSSADYLTILAIGSAGAIWSCASDMLSFLAAAVGLVETPLAPAFKAALAIRGLSPSAGTTQCLGWLIDGEAGLVGHDGGTIGMASTARADPAEQIGVVVLCNASSAPGAFADNLIRPERPGDDGPPNETHTAVQLTSAELDRCLGRYAMGDGAECELIRDGETLVVKAPNAPPLPLQAASPSKFFSTFVPLTLDFDLSEDGPAKAVLIHFGGAEIPAPRIA